MSARILFYSHQANLAGAPLSLAGLINQLPKKYQCIWVCPERGPVMKVIHSPQFVIGSWFQKQKIMRLIQQHRIQLVHANTLFAWPAVSAAKALNIPVVWHIREDVTLFPKSMTKKVTQYSDHIILISNWMKKFFIKSNNTTITTKTHSANVFWVEDML
jgi:UDP-N-acetylglucosamine:LPS N-acetylglucosamine transferase